MNPPNQPNEPYEVYLERQPEKLLKKLPSHEVRRLDTAIRSLATHPRPPGCKKLAGSTDTYRIRVGDWRILYVIEDNRLIVLVVRIDQRDSVYKTR